MPNTLTSIFVSNPATEPVEAPHPNTGVYVTGTQASAGGPWTVVHTLVTKTSSPLTMVGRLKNFPAVTVSVVASGGPNAGNIFNNVLATPTGAAATATSSSALSVAVSSIANQTGYRLLSAPAAGGPFTQLYQGTTASYPHIGLTAGQTVYYQWQYVGGGFYDDSLPSAVFSGVTSVAAAVTYDMTVAGGFGHTLQDFDSGQGYRVRTGMAQSPTITTNAASLSIRLASPMITLGYSGSRATVDVFVDGVYYSSVVATAAAATAYPVPLPNDGASHAVYFVEGLAMYATDTTYGGTYLLSVAVPAGATASNTGFARLAKRLALSTDSVLGGDHASTPAKSIVLQMRKLYPAWEIADIGFCGRTATKAWNTDTAESKEASDVQLWMSGATEKVWAMQLGANDANQSLDPLGFETRVALVTNKVYAADSAIKVALIRPFFTNYAGLSEPNLQILRNNLVTLANQRPNYCTSIDTSTDITASNSVQYQFDGLHFNDAGHAYEAPLLGQKLTTLLANTAPAVVVNKYQTISYQRVFTDLVNGALADGWNTNAGTYNVDRNGLNVTSYFATNSTGSLYAARQYGDCRVVVRVSRALDTRIFLVARHDTTTLNKTGFWVTGTVDERFDTGMVNAATVTSYTPAIADSVPLPRSTEFFMEIEVTGTTANYRSYVPGPNNDESNRPNAPQATRTFPAGISATGYVGLLTTGTAAVLVKEMRIYIV